MTLNALTDLSDREEVNVNLLTHLEYERALHLVGTGMNFPAAKRRAESEIFNAFGIAGDFANSEDLSIFESGDGNAALLAFSVLMLGDLTEADLTERLTKFAADSNALSSNYHANSKVRYICETGAWREATNVEKNTYGHVCSTAEVGAVICGEVEDEHYICKANLGSCGWQEATAVEVDTRGWGAGSDGELRTGDSTTAIYKYDEALDEWVAAMEKDKTLGLKGCSTNREGDVGLSSTDDFHYMCKAGYWTMVGGEVF